MSIAGLDRFSVKTIAIEGVPASVSASAAATFRSRIDRAARELMTDQNLPALEILLSTGTPPESAGRTPEANSSERPHSPTTNYVCREPLYTMDRLVIATQVRDELENAMKLLELENLIFEAWGLKAIEPNPKSALSLYGPPGTGKTMAAHAIAHATGRKILCASYADIESMYHGEGPKNVCALFHTAQEQSALLFLDEADSLLGKRLTHVTQGSEQAINSLRSQLLLSLDNFRGIVVFATNLIENYDPAFDSRVHHVHFPLPDRVALEAIWRHHLPPGLPLDGVSVEDLAASSEGLAGRDVKTAVISAAVSAARNNTAVTHERLLYGIQAIRASRRQKEATQIETEP